MQQVKILPPGLQKWNPKLAAVCEAKQWICYCSSLAVFLYDLETKSIKNIIAGHTVKPISCLAWSPYNTNLIAFGSHDKKILLWDLENGTEPIASCSFKSSPICVEWTNKSDTLAVATGIGDVFLYYYQRNAPKEKLKYLSKYDASDPMRPTVLRCSRTKDLRVVVGLYDGRVIMFREDGSGQIQFDAPWKEDTSITSRLNIFGTGKKKEKAEKNKCSGQYAVVDVAFDPFSLTYFLAAYKINCIVLWDGDTRLAMNIFDCRKFGVSSISWIGSAPGNFISCSEKSGVIKTWNVSQPQSISQLKIAGSGLLYLGVDKEICVFTCMDGSVGAFNLSSSKSLLLTLPGHRETVFDLRYCPTDSEIVATCSFDSTIKIWHSTKMMCSKTLTGQQGIIYGISWSPDGCFIASCSSKGEIFIWDVTKSRAVHKIQAHSGKIAFRICWSPDLTRKSNINLENTLIASCAEDLNCTLINGKTGKIVCKIPHPMPPFGCSWNSFQNLIATGCKDGIVRIWNIRSELIGSQGTSEKKILPLLELRGHKLRIFNVAWSPIQKSMLASGSDDKCIRVWDISRSPGSELISTLEGHTMNVRALVWSSEIPWLLVSGSWDSTIRIWNAETGQLLHVISDHHADVYGLDAHPRRPFLIASSSRDNTIRFWNLDSTKLIKDIRLSALANVFLNKMNQSDPSLVPTIEHTFSKFVGTESKVVVECLRNSKESFVSKVTSLLLFFHGAPGIEDLCSLLKYCSGNGTSSTQTQEFHHSDTLIDRSEVQLEMLLKRENLQVKDLTTKAVKRKEMHTLSSKSYERVERIIHGYSKLGQWKTVCDLLFSLGEHEKALSLAPAVSMNYWRQLSNEYAKRMLVCNREQSVTNMLVSGNLMGAVEVLKDNDKLYDAFLVLKVSEERKVFALNNPKSPVGSRCIISPKKKISRKSKENGIGIDVAYEAAKTRLENGEGVVAACILLSVNEYEGAVQILLSASQMELAFAVDMCLALTSKNHTMNKMTIHNFCRSCEHAGLSKLSLKLLDATKSGIKEKQLLCARTGDKDLFILAGLQHPENYGRKNVSSTKIDTIKAFCISGTDSNVNRAAKMAVELLTHIFSQPTWDILLVEEIIKFISTIDFEKLTSVEDKMVLLAVSSYNGALQALYKGLHSVVGPLYENIFRILKNDHLLRAFPVPMVHVILSELRYWVSQTESITAGRSIETCLSRWRVIKTQTNNYVDNSNNACLNDAILALEKIEKQFEVQKLKKYDNKHPEDKLDENKCTREGKTEKPFTYTRDEIEATKKEPYLGSTPGMRFQPRGIDLKFQYRPNTSKIALGRYLPGNTTKTAKRSWFSPNDILRGPIYAFDNNNENAVEFGTALDWLEVNPFSPLNDGSRLII